MPVRSSRWISPSWQGLQTGSQFFRSQNSLLSPRCGVRWFTTVAGTIRPRLSHRSHSGFASRKAPRAFCHLPPYPRSAVLRLSLRQLGSATSTGHILMRRSCTSPCQLLSAASSGVYGNDLSRPILRTMEVYHNLPGLACLLSRLLQSRVNLAQLPKCSALVAANVRAKRIGQRCHGKNERYVGHQPTATSMVIACHWACALGLRYMRTYRFDPTTRMLSRIARIASSQRSSSMSRRVRPSRSLRLIRP